jgi:dihydroxyacetone kinase
MGTGMALSARALIAKNSPNIADKEYLDQYLFEMGDTTSKVCGGSSGPFYGAFIIAISDVFKQARLMQKPLQFARLFYEGFVNGKNAIQYLGRAEFTDRTMLYVLHKITEDMKSQYEAGDLDSMTAKDFFRAASGSGDVARKQAMGIMPRFGRSQYIGDRVLGMEDPGCEFVYEWCDFIATSL